MSAAFVALSRFTVANGMSDEVRQALRDQHGRTRSAAGGGAVFRVLLPRAAAPARVEAAR